MKSDTEDDKDSDSDQSDAGKGVKGKRLGDKLFAED